MSSRARIESVALTLFAERGYEGVSLQRVADEVGLHKSSLFHHYKNKRELFHAVVAEVLQSLVETMRPYVERDEPTLDNIVALVKAVAGELGARPEAARVLLHVMVASRESPMAIDTTDGQHPLVELLTRLVDLLLRAQAAGAIRPAPIRFVLFELMGVLLLHPAAASQLRVIAGSKPHAPKQVAALETEVEAFLRGALAP